MDMFGGILLILAGGFLAVFAGRIAPQAPKRRRAVRASGCTMAAVGVVWLLAVNYGVMLL